MLWRRRLAALRSQVAKGLRCIDRDLAKMARAVANHSGTQIADYLSGLLRPTITKDYRKMLQELDTEAGENS